MKNECYKSYRSDCGCCVRENKAKHNINNSLVINKQNLIKLKKERKLYFKPVNILHSQ